MSSWSRIQLERWLQTIDVKVDKVLDVGGSQFPVKGRTKSWEVEEYKILDLGQPHNCIQTPDIIQDINEEFDIPYTDFDIAFCLEVSEYLWNPVQALININKCLKEGGILYLSSHFIYPVHTPVENDCLRYTRKGIITMLEKTGFEIIEIIPRMETEDARVQWGGYCCEQGMRMAKDYFLHNEVGHLLVTKKIK